MRHLGLLWRHRALISVLTQRELAARYRASVLGFLWSLLNPLMILTVYAVVFTTVFQPRFEGGKPYPLFLFAGLLPWMFFSGAILDAAITLVDNGPLLAKVMCPPELFPAVVVLSHLVHHLFALPVLIGAMWAASLFGWHSFPWTIALLPAALLPWILVTAGGAAAISAAAVRLRDLRDLVGHLLNLLFFASPIIYSLEVQQMPGALLRVLRFNPMAPLVTTYRDLVFTGKIPSPGQWLLAYGVGITAWIIGTMIFSRLRDSLVEAV